LVQQHGPQGNPYFRRLVKRIGNNDDGATAFHASASRALADAPWQKPDWREQLTRGINESIRPKRNLHPAIIQAVRATGVRSRWSPNSR
jgi:hypothetical protein